MNEDTITIQGLRNSLKKIPKEAANELRDASKAIAAHVATDARSHAYRVGRQGTLLAPTLKATRDRVPVISMGSTKRIPGKKTILNQIAKGFEFGSYKHKQFLPYLPSPSGRGGKGYVMYEAVRDNRDYILDNYLEALTDALDDSTKKDII